MTRLAFRDDFADRNEIHLSWTADTATTMHVVWKTSEPEAALAARVRAVGTNDWTTVAASRRAVVDSGAVVQAEFNGLTPQSRYEYSVETRPDQWSDVRSFATAAPALQRFAFNAAFVADTGLVGRRDGLTSGTSRVIDSIAEYQPLLILEGGDFAYFDTDRRFEFLEDAIDYFFNQMEPAFSIAPVQPTWGNHELVPFLQEELPPWTDRFATPEGLDGGLCYSFDVGHVHFISLCAEELFDPIPQERLEWLIADIKQAQADGFDWVIPFLHVAPFADGTNHPSNVKLREQLGPVFEEFNIRLALTTHDQAYERTFPLRDVPATNSPTTTALTDYSPDEGTVWAKVSPGGKMSNINKSFSNFAHDEAPSWTAVRSNVMHCWAKLEFDETGGLTVTVVGVPGNSHEEEVVLDEFRYAPPRS